MGEFERLRLLTGRLDELQQRVVAAWERPIRDVALLALKEQIASIVEGLGRWQLAPLND